MVATPIGNLQDFSPRARDVLSTVDLILAEDTRHSQTLLRQFSINTPLKSCHEHNEDRRIGEMLEFLGQGHDIAFISDAGTPLISDPGYRLVAAAHDHAIRVIPIPGPSACISALSVSGLPTDRFRFIGYLPAKQGARLKALEDLAREQDTLIFYEAPHRIRATLNDAIAVFGASRLAMMAREMTKLYEETHRSGLADCLAWVDADAGRGKGEYVLIVQGAQAADADSEAALRILKILLAELPKNKAAELTARITGMKKNELYRLALDLDE